MVELIKYNNEYENDVSEMIVEFWKAHNSTSSLLDASTDIKNWSSAGHFLFVICCENVLVGFLHIGSRGTDKADWIEDIYILPEYRHKGIATSAIEKAELLIKQNGSTSMYIEVVPSNSGAIRLYHKLGFNRLSLITLSKDFIESDSVGEEVVCGLPFHIKNQN